MKPDYVEAYYNLGITLQELDRLDEAGASYRQAISLKPDYAEAHTNLGNTLKELRRLEEAVASYKQAMAQRPDYPDAHSNLGITLKELGRLDEAEASYRQALSLDERCSEEQHCDISFALAKACEDLGDFQQSFKYYSKGNALHKKFLNYDISQDIELFKQLITYYPRIGVNSLGGESLSSELTPTFIVGMPRSGTTLVEQIISSHSQVTGAGELTFASDFGDSIARGLSQSNTDTLLNFRENYLRRLQALSNGSLMVTDKMPQNFRYIGLLASAFPDAKIVHVKRNSAAVCWGSYKQLFASKSLGYCYGLDDVVTYYALYQNLMEFWELQLPNRIYNLDYELLTANQEDETKKVVQYLGLSWENECLSPQNNRRSVATASNAQVRVKVYQGSSQQWRKFEPFLGGVLDKLED